jgi:hypothetical protein
MNTEAASILIDNFKIADKIRLSFYRYITADNIGWYILGEVFHSLAAVTLIVDRLEIAIENKIDEYEYNR